MPGTLVGRLGDRATFKFDCHGGLGPHWHLGLDGIQSRLDWTDHVPRRCLWRGCDAGRSWSTQGTLSLSPSLSPSLPPSLSDSLSLSLSLCLSLAAGAPGGLGHNTPDRCLAIRAAVRVASRPRPARGRGGGWRGDGGAGRATTGLRPRSDCLAVYCNCLYSAHTVEKRKAIR